MSEENTHNECKICTHCEFFPRIFASPKLANDICFIMTFFRISVRKTSGENSHWNEENTVKMIQSVFTWRPAQPSPCPDRRWVRPRRSSWEWWSTTWWGVGGRLGKRLKYYRIFLGTFPISKHFPHCLSYSSERVCVKTVVTIMGWSIEWTQFWLFVHFFAPDPLSGRAPCKKILMERQERARISGKL